MLSEGRKIMDEYLLNKKNITREQRRKARAIDLLSKGIGVEEIAEIMEVSEKTVREYLGKQRIEEFERSIMGEAQEEAEEEVSEIKAKPEEEKAKKENSEEQEDHGLKLTESRVEELTSERNDKIIKMYNEGVSIQEIAKKEGMTVNQVKECYLSLGLSVYTKEEIEEMKKEEAKRKARETRKRRQAQKKEEERRKLEQEKEKEKEEEKKGEEEKQEDDVTSYQYIRKRMGELVREGKSKAAIDFGNTCLENESLLTGEERSRLFMLIEYIEDVREKYRRSQRLKSRENESKSKAEEEEER